MQTLDLAIELSNMALQDTPHFKSPSELIQTAKDRLHSQMESLGRYINCAQGHSREMNDNQMKE